jgi:hypothetical protein
MPSRAVGVEGAQSVGDRFRVAGRDDKAVDTVLDKVRADVF